MVPVFTLFFWGAYSPIRPFEWTYYSQGFDKALWVHSSVIKFQLERGGAKLEVQLASFRGARATSNGEEDFRMGVIGAVLNKVNMLARLQKPMGEA